MTNDFEIFALLANRFIASINQNAISCCIAILFIDHVFIQLTNINWFWILLFCCFCLLLCMILWLSLEYFLTHFPIFLKDSMIDESREKPCIFSSSMKPFDLSEATKLSLVLSASQHINQQQLKDSFMKNFSRYSTSDFDDTDSRFSFSSSSSPVHVRIFKNYFVIF